MAFVPTLMRGVSALGPILGRAGNLARRVGGWGVRQATEYPALTAAELVALTHPGTAPASMSIHPDDQAALSQIEQNLLSLGYSPSQVGSMMQGGLWNNGQFDMSLYQGVLDRGAITQPAPVSPTPVIPGGYIPRPGEPKYVGQTPRPTVVSPHVGPTPIVPSSTTIPTKSTPNARTASAGIQPVFPATQLEQRNPRTGETVNPVYEHLAQAGNRARSALARAHPDPVGPIDNPMLSLPKRSPMLTSPLKRRY